MPSRGPSNEFAVCLSHDVDRVHKSYQYLFECIVNLDLRKVAGILDGTNPWWQFHKIMAIEEALGVRSTFNILDEKHIFSRPYSEILSLDGWKLYAGRYDITDGQLSPQLRLLNDLGWEIGLQGSYTSGNDRARLAYEKDRIEAITDAKIVGNRQHYLRLTEPDTWKHLRDVGIKYDTSIADKQMIHFQRGYNLKRPFGDDFVVFPWTVMDITMMNAGDDLDEMKSKCDELLNEAKRRQSVVVLDWHQRVFHKPDFPHWSDVYEYLIRTAKEEGAWVGPPGEFYEATPHPEGTVNDALRELSER